VIADAIDIIESIDPMIGIAFWVETDPARGFNANNWFFTFYAAVP